MTDWRQVLPLNGDAPSVTCTIDWSSALPTEWTVKPLKYVATINDDKLPDDTRPDYEIEYVDVGSVTMDGGIVGTELILFEDAPTRARRRVRNGDTILSTVRTYLKAVARVVEPPENLIVSTGFAVIRPCELMWPAFLFRLIQSHSFIQRVVANSDGVAYPAINPSRLGSLRVWVPPLEEQRAISLFLDERVGAIDTLSSELGVSIGLLDEYRSSLVNAAVSGQIDVRTYRAPEPKEVAECL